MAIHPNEVDDEGLEILTRGIIRVPIGIALDTGAIVYSAPIQEEEPMADFRDTLWRLDTALEQLQNFDFEEVANEFHEMAVERNTAQTALKQAEKRIAELEQEVENLRKKLTALSNTPKTSVSTKRLFIEWGWEDQDED